MNIPTKFGSNEPSGLNSEGDCTYEDDDGDSGRQVMAIPRMTGLTSGVADRFECPAPPPCF